METIKRPIQKLLPDYIKYKKSLGYKYDNISHFYKIEKILAKYNIYSIDEINQEILKYPDLKKYKNELNELIKFYNIINNIPQPTKLQCRTITPSKYIPFIIKEPLFYEICNFVDKTSQYEKGNEQYIYPVLYRLLYSTGIRINEAINLKRSDIESSTNVIKIQNSKNNKSRCIVVSDSMNAILKKYLEVANPKKYLFEMNKNKVGYSTLSNHLKEICHSLNVKITFHDFRHSMATITFQKMLADGYNEKEILYYLHIYLGHSSINETEYYFYFNNIIKDNFGGSK